MKFLAANFGKFLAFLISSMPIKIRIFCGNIIGILWFDILRIRRKVALDNLRLAFPEKSEAERIQMARNSLKNMGHNILEYGLFRSLTKQRAQELVEFKGLDLLEDALKQNKGCLLLAMHLANGDLCTSATSLMGFPLYLISKVFKTQWLNDMWFDLRKKHGTHFISPEKSSFDILRALNKNGVVIFVLDQFMGPPIGTRTKFFGVETGTAMGLALVHLRTKAPLLLTYNYRKPDGTLCLNFEKIDFANLLDTDLDHREQTISTLTQLYTDKIELTIRKYPDQWMWIHRRWKKFVDEPKT